MMDEVLAVAIRGDALKKAAERRDKIVARRSKRAAEGIQDRLTH
jgi:hypothetical protein